jgi:hypothetical protein
VSDSADTAERLIATAAMQLASGGLVALPTETVYGLGADAGNEIAVAKIFKAKGRPADHPLRVTSTFPISRAICHRLRRNSLPRSGPGRSRSSCASRRASPMW